MKSNTFAANLVADQAKQARKENVTTTTNGAKAFKSTLNANVDLHAKLGSARQLSEAAIILYLPGWISFILNSPTASVCPG